MLEVVDLEVAVEVGEVAATKIFRRSEAEVEGTKLQAAREAALRLVGALEVTLVEAVLVVVQVGVERLPLSGWERTNTHQEAASISKTDMTNKFLQRC